jgi:hypothetical protein
MPTLESLTALTLASLAVMGSPGPATISVTAVGGTFGVKRALPYLAGLILGTTTVLLIVAAGLTTVLLSLPFLAPVLVAGSLVYVLDLAYRIATAPPLAEIHPAAVAPPLWGGLALGIANPKAYFAIAAVFAANRLAADPPLDAIEKTPVITRAQSRIGRRARRLFRAGAGSTRRLRAPLALSRYLGFRGWLGVRYHWRIVRALPG